MAKNIILSIPIIAISIFGGIQALKYFYTQDPITNVFIFTFATIILIYIFFMIYDSLKRSH